MLLKKGAPDFDLERLFLCTGRTATLALWRKKLWKEVRSCLFCLSGLFIASPPALADNACGSEYIDETTTIRYIHDGDTLHLRDGRKVRLVGINTPELARKNKAAEPFAKAAKNALKSLFRNDKTIKLRFGKVKKDRYGRYLAHGFLLGGENVQAILLNQGLASVINVPPNTQFSACYLEQELKARCNKTGLWERGKILQAKNLKNKHVGFYLVQGIVTKVRSNKKGIWLTIDNKLTVGIRPDDQFLFDIKTINNMVNQSVIVRGWINESKRSTPFYVRTRHPLSIQLSETFSCS
jgi:endonuclease YncB( thermonuclease family)